MRRTGYCVWNSGSTRGWCSATTFKEDNRERSVWRASGAKEDFADQKGFEDSGRGGYAPEIAYFECLHEIEADR